jgi:hypothetical protein
MGPRFMKSSLLSGKMNALNSPRSLTEATARCLGRSHALGHGQRDGLFQPHGCLNKAA